MNFRSLFACLATTMLAACASTLPPVDPAPPTVVMLSIDGLNPEALGKGNSPHLDKLARSGATARWMTPSYPAITFPNHYTLVTGKRPDHHGLIHNVMNDPALGRFELKDRDAVQTPGWWEGALPLWIHVSRNGLRSASWAYPGGETHIDGQLPDQMHPYDESVSPSGRMQQLLKWLDQPERLHFIAAYFEHVDQAGHYFGPQSTEHANALRQVDAAIGELVDGLRQRGQLDNINLLIVSDHGMAEVKSSNYVVVEQMVSPAIARNVMAGQVVGFEPLEGKETIARQSLLGRHDHYECRTRDALPAHWKFGTHPRVPAIICQMDEGWDAIFEDAVAGRRNDRLRGSHGYEPTLPSMRAVFIAHGPSFRQEVEIEPIDNVDVFPLVNHLLGLPSPDNDGKLQSTKPALR